MDTNSKKVLLIEDEEALAQLYRTNLELAGYQVDEAHDGKVGLAYALHHNPDLILLDLMLPVMNGFDVLKILNDNGLTQKIPVLVITNLSQDEITEAKELGAAECIIKAEVTPEEVIEKVQEHLKKGENLNVGQN